MPFGPLRKHVRRRFVGSFALVLSGSALAAYVVMIRMPGRSYAGPFVTLDDSERALEAEPRADVRVLTADIGERNPSHSTALAAAASFVESSFRQAGLTPNRLPFGVLGEPAFRRSSTRCPTRRAAQRAYPSTLAPGTERESGWAPRAVRDVSVAHAAAPWRTLRIP
jgi:hypothetical protein